MPFLIGRFKTLAIITPGLWLGGLLSFCVGLLFYMATARTIESDARDRFKNVARSAQYTINARIKSYTDVLRASASVFETSHTLSREQFHRFVSGLSLAQQFPAIESVSFARSITDEERDAFETQMTRAGVLAEGDSPDFAIWPPGRRPSYSVVVYVEPPAYRTLIRLGYDLETRSEDAQRLLHDSRDIGALSTASMLIQGMPAGNRIGMGMRLPVYRAGAPLGTVEQRRAAYFGSVGIAFNVQKLVHGVLGEMPIRHVRMSLFNYVTTPGRGGQPTAQLLFDSSATEANPRPPLNSIGPGLFGASLPVDFNGREWTVHFSVAKSELYSNADGYFPWLAMVAGSVGSMLVYALLQSLTSSRRRAITIAKRMTRELRDSQAKLQLSHENLRRLAAHADHIKEDERKRIAREIHDDLGQNLLVLRMEADMLSSRTGGRHPRLHARAQATLSQIDATIKSVRQIINDLRPNVLDLGLSAAVEWQVGEFGRRTGIECELADDHQDDELDDRYATAFFRVLQESLSNIARHAQASAVKVELKLQAGRLSMTVSDNGVGLPAGGRNKTGSFGLVGIEERIHLLGGVCSILSFPGSGTAVYVSVPVHAKCMRAGAHAPLVATVTDVVLA
jgi:signal transduction histidine kinase